MATTSGPSTGTPSLTFQLPGGPVTESLEIQVPLGLPSLEPSRAPFADPTQAGTTITGAAVPVTNKTLTFGSTGATVVFASPA